MKRAPVIPKHTMKTTTEDTYSLRPLLHQWSTH